MKCIFFAELHNKDNKNAPNVPANENTVTRITISNSIITSLGLRNITIEATTPAINPTEVPIPTKFPKDFIQLRIHILSLVGKNT